MASTYEIYEQQPESEKLLSWLRTKKKEDIIEPNQKICDPHHHLWNRVELVEDIGSGHNVVKTVFLECGWSFRKDGPREMKAVGEVEFCQKFHDQANILTNVNVNAGIAGRVSKISFP